MIENKNATDANQQKNEKAINNTKHKLNANVNDSANERDLYMAPGQQGQEVLEPSFAHHAVDLLLSRSGWCGATLGLQWTCVSGLALAHGPRAQRAGRALRALPVLYGSGSGAARPPGALRERIGRCAPSRVTGGTKRFRQSGIG